MVSTLSGPLDMSNGNFGINSINAGEREKGPQKEEQLYFDRGQRSRPLLSYLYTGLVTLARRS